MMMTVMLVLMMVMMVMMVMTMVTMVCLCSRRRDRLGAAEALHIIRRLLQHRQDREAVLEGHGVVQR